MGDPRYEKLQRMLDEGRNNLDEALRNILHENQVRQDILARPNAIDFAVRDQHVYPQLVNGDTQEFSMTRHSEGQLFGRANIPVKYAQRLLEIGENDLLRSNLDRMKSHYMKDGVMLRQVDGRIKGWLSPAYKRMDSGPVIESFVERAVKGGLSPLAGRNTDYRYQIQFVAPEVISIDTGAGEHTVFGLSLVTGDYGSQALEINMLAIRIACMNLAEGYDVFRRVHLGSRVRSDQDAIILSQKTLELDSRALGSAIGDVVGQFSDHVNIVVSKIKEAASKEIKDITPIMQQFRNKGMKKDVAEQIKALYLSDSGTEILPQGNTQWRLSNAISYVAKGAPTADGLIDMQRLAMTTIN